MKERSARRAAPREGERSQVAEVLNICIVDPSTIWRHTAREILCRELDANGVRACVDEFYAPESMTSDGGCAYYDVVLADISDRQTREQYLRFFRDLRLTSPQTKLIILSVMAALGACGASGVAGGSLLLIPMACSLFGISNDVAMQVVGVGFIIGVIQDSLETAINSSSDALFTAVAEFRQWRKNGKEIQF